MAWRWRCSRLGLCRTKIVRVSEIYASEQCPRQDSNLRSRLRRGLPCVPPTSRNEFPHILPGGVSGAGGLIAAHVLVGPACRSAVAGVIQVMAPEPASERCRGSVLSDRRQVRNIQIRRLCRADQRPGHLAAGLPGCFSLARVVFPWCAALYGQNQAISAWAGLVILPLCSGW